MGLGNSQDTTEDLDEQQEKFLRECSADNLRFEKEIKKNKMTFVDTVEKRKLGSKWKTT